MTKLQGIHSRETVGAFPSWKAEIFTIPEKFGVKLRLDKLSVLELPAGLERVWDDWFCKSLIRKVVIPRSVRWLESGAFCQCKRLSSVEIEPGSALEKIGVSCFQDCRLTEFCVPACVRQIKSFAFYRCKQLSVLRFEATERKIPDTEIKVERHAFGLTQLTPDMVTPPEGVFIPGTAF